MQLFNNAILYIMMFCALVGAIASIVNSDSKLGKEFLEGIYSIGNIFIPVAGITALIPILSKGIKNSIAPLFKLLGADPSLAATTFIAVDMGGYQLAKSLALSKEGWIIAMITGYMAGATIIFSIPVGLSMLDKKDHKYMALGVTAGILSIPIGVFISSVILLLSNISIRSEISTYGIANYKLQLSFYSIFKNLTPIIIICIFIAVLLKLIPNKMINIFIIFGKVINAIVKIVLVVSIIEYFTGIFSKIVVGWNLNPIIADKNDQFRALEMAGCISIMLAGAFPMVYLMQKYLKNVFVVLGKKLGLSLYGITGVVAGIANILALFRMIKYMNAEDKVKVIAFSVCSAFLLGDHLAFTANFQPTMILAIIIGKLSAGIISIYIAKWLVVPQAIILGQNDIS